MNGNIDLEKSTYELWKSGKIGNFGSFHTSLLKTYGLADADNQKRLADAFPEWFKTQAQMRAEAIDDQIENMGEDA